jgi:hypothetical protein
MKVLYIAMLILFLGNTNDILSRFEIQDTVIQILEKQPGLPYLNPEFLEAISAPKPILEKDDAENRAAHQKKQALLFKLKVEGQPAADPPAEPENLLPLEDIGDIGDLFADLALLERAGIGFGREENMRIYLALKMLLHTPKDLSEGEKITRVRLWGKILGTKQVRSRSSFEKDCSSTDRNAAQDYLIAECVISERKERPPLPQASDSQRFRVISQRIAVRKFGKYCRQNWFYGISPTTTSLSFSFRFPSLSPNLSLPLSPPPLRRWIPKSSCHPTPPCRNPWTTSQGAHTANKV